MTCKNLVLTVLEKVMLFPDSLEIVLFVLEPVPLLGQRLDLLKHLFRIELEPVGLLRFGVEPCVKLRDLKCDELMIHVE